MRIHFERSGGFAGMFIQVMIDTESLLPEDAGKLFEMVETSSFFDLAEQISSSTSGADQFFYRITIEKANQQYTVETSDGAAPESLRPLLRELTIRARSAR